MLIRRGDVTDIAWVFAGLEMNCLITIKTRRVDSMPPPCCNYVFWQATNQIWGSIVLSKVSATEEGEKL